MMAQQDQTCGSDILFQIQKSNNPNFIDDLNRINKETYDRINTLQKTSNQIDGVYRIPVVVHLIGSQVINSVTQSKIDEQIQILNDDFRKALGTNGYGSGVDTKIEFCLATYKADGTMTSGVTQTYEDPNDPWPSRWFSSKKRDDDPKLKSLVHWNPDKFLNVYVVSKIWTHDKNGNESDGVLGYAYRPDGIEAYPSLKALDGIVVALRAFGLNLSAYPKHLGRTLTHEAGHWLNLKHPWGDDPHDCSVDDDVDDTPICKDAKWVNSPCIGPNQCPTENFLVGSTDVRLIENYMDYSGEDCMNLFTPGQRARMRDCLRSFRWSLTTYATDHVSCIQNHCSNGVKDPGEAGIDCGGVDCPPCHNYGGGFSCTGHVGKSKLYVANGQSDLQKIAIICHTQPSFHHYYKYCDTYLPNANKDRKSSDLCELACEDGDLLSGLKCWHSSVFFSLQKVNFNYTTIGPEYSRYIEAINGCDPTDDWIYTGATFYGSTLPNNITELVDDPSITIQRNVLYRVKLAGNYIGSGWEEQSTFFYSIGNVFEPDLNYQLSLGFGKIIRVSESIDPDLVQVYSANDHIEFLPGANISTTTGNSKLFQISSFSCNNTPYQSIEASDSIVSNFKPIPEVGSFSKNIKLKNSVEVYPNPFKGDLLNIKPAKGKIAKVDISTANGIHVAGTLIESSDLSSREVKYQFNNRISPGLYLVTVHFDDESQSMKKVIVR
jgi:hypothetical protein